MNSNHFAASSFEQGIEPLDEEVFEYLEGLEEQALSELTEIWNWSTAAWFFLPVSKQSLT